MNNRLSKDCTLINWAGSLVGTPFKKGYTDCNMLTLNVVDIYQGSNLVSLFEGNFTTYKEGLLQAKEHLGTARMAEYLEQIGTEVDVTEVTVGDILVKPLSRYDACTICLGEYYLDACIKEKVVKFNQYEFESLKDFKAFRL